MILKKIYYNNHTCQISEMLNVRDLYLNLEGLGGKTVFIRKSEGLGK